MHLYLHLAVYELSNNTSFVFICRTVVPTFTIRALVVGPQCHMLILRNGNVPCRCFFCNFHVVFKTAKCPLSNLRKGLCHVVNIYSHVDKLHVTCRFKEMHYAHVALSILRVKGPTIDVCMSVGSTSGSGYRCL